MKRIILICVLAVVFLNSFVVFAGNTIPVSKGVIMMTGADFAYVDGEKTELDETPVVVNDRTFVPLRFCAEALQAEVMWIDETQSVVVKKNGKIVEFYIGSTVYKINGSLFEADAAPFLQNGRTMLPIRFLAEALDEKVEWYESGIITISVDDYSEAGRMYLEGIF